MNEYKFYARIISDKLTVVLFIILLTLFFILVFLFFKTSENNLIITSLLITSLISLLFLNILSSRYIKIIATDNFISIYYWNKLKYSTSVNQLIEIQGVDIDKKFNRVELRFIFDDRIFIFSLWEYNLMSKSNMQTKILRDLVEKYQLQKQRYKTRFIDVHYTYKYINPTYNKKER